MFGKNRCCVVPVTTKLYASSVVSVTTKFAASRQRVKFIHQDRGCTYNLNCSVIAWGLILVDNGLHVIWLGAWVLVSSLNHSTIWQRSEIQKNNMR